MQRELIPRLPVFGWQAFAGRRATAMPCLLDLPNLHYTTSGRASILLALEALGVGRGDGVLLPTYHCPTMVAPASDLGALPVFYPIDATGAPDLAWLDGRPLQGVRALVAAHYFGLPQPMAELRRWCSSRGIALIEDCAHALFGHSGDRPVGAWGDLAIASLTKFLPVPEGGCLVVNVPTRVPPLSSCSLATHLRAAVDILDVGAAQGQLTGLNGLISGVLSGLRRLRGASPAAVTPIDAPLAADVEPRHLGPDFTIDTALAHRELARPCRWVARAMPRERIVQRRRRNFETLRAMLVGRAGMHPLLPALPPDCAPYVFPLWVDDPDPGYAELKRLGMPVFRWDRHWPGVPEMPGDNGLPWAHHVLQLACHQDLGEADLQRLVHALDQVYSPPRR